MKKILFIALILISPISVGASVDSDTMALRYQKCIHDLAILDSLNYIKPSQQDAESLHISYDQAITRWNNQITYREKKRAECRSLSGSTTTNTPTQKTAVKTPTPETVSATTVPLKSDVSPEVSYFKDLQRTIQYTWIFLGVITLLLLIGVIKLLTIKKQP